MARPIQQVDLDVLSTRLKEARERKGWTLQQLSHELWAQGFATSQNKLWRMENDPPKRVDTELLLWLEKTLGVDLLPAEPEQSQLLLADVLELVDAFVEAKDRGGRLPPMPANRNLRELHGRLERLAGAGHATRAAQ